MTNQSLRERKRRLRGICQCWKAVRITQMLELDRKHSISCRKRKTSIVLPWNPWLLVSFHVADKLDQHWRSAVACICLWPWEKKQTSESLEVRSKCTKNECTRSSGSESGGGASSYYNVCTSFVNTLWRVMWLANYQNAVQSKWTIIHLDGLKTKEWAKSMPSRDQRSSGQK